MIQNKKISHQYLAVVSQTVKHDNYVCRSIENMWSEWELFDMHGVHLTCHLSRNRVQGAQPVWKVFTEPEPYIGPQLEHSTYMWRKAHIPPIRPQAFCDHTSTGFLLPCNLQNSIPSCARYHDNSTFFNLFCKYEFSVSDKVIVILKVRWKEIMEK